jgi:hypothetical protein
VPQLDAMELIFLIPIAAIIGGCSFGIVKMITTNARHTKVRVAEEQTRRELAAYVAEGSMTPDEAERILSAGRSPEPALD